MNVEEALNGLPVRLAAHSDSALLDAQVLLAHILGKTRAWTLAHLEAELLPEQIESLNQAAVDLEKGVPLPYVLGHWEFYGLHLLLTPDVLIPRPETELLVEQALQWLVRRPPGQLGVDVGTGSGCIAAAVTKNHPGIRFIASDISQAALQVAYTNMHHLGVSARVDCVRSDLLPAASRLFDLICANLPYIPEETVKDLSVYRREPSLALTPGPDGLALIRRLLAAAPQQLAPDGLGLVEIEFSQGAAALDLARAAFPEAQVDLLQDLSGRDRLVRIENRGRSA